MTSRIVRARPTHGTNRVAIVRPSLTWSISGTRPNGESLGTPAPPMNREISPESRSGRVSGAPRTRTTARPTATASPRDQPHTKAPRHRGPHPPPRQPGPGSGGRPEQQVSHAGRRHQGSYRDPAEEPTRPGRLFGGVPVGALVAAACVGHLLFRSPARSWPWLAGGGVGAAVAGRLGVGLVPGARGGSRSGCGPGPRGSGDPAGSRFGADLAVHGRGRRPEALAIRSRAGDRPGQAGPDDGHPVRPVGGPRPDDPRGHDGLLSRDR